MKEIVPLNVDSYGIARTITADYGHASAYHILFIKERFSLMGVLEIYERDTERDMG